MCPLVDGVVGWRILFDGLPFLLVFPRLLFLGWGDGDVGKMGDTGR